MYQHRYRHRLDDSFAAVLTDIGFLFLSTLCVVGLTYRLRVRQQCCEGTTFRASRELIVAVAVFLHNDHMASVAAIRRELQGLHPLLHLVDFRQVETIVLTHHLATLQTLTFLAAFCLFL